MEIETGTSLNTHNSSMDRWIANTSTGSFVATEPFSLLSSKSTRKYSLLGQPHSLFDGKYKNLVDIPYLPRSLCIRFVLLLST